MSTTQKQNIQNVDILGQIGTLKVVNRAVFADLMDFDHQEVHVESDDDGFRDRGQQSFPAGKGKGDTGAVLVCQVGMAPPTGDS